MFFVVVFAEDIDDCVANECEFGATCIDGIQEYSCVCSTGSFGDFCQRKRYTCTCTFNCCFNCQLRRHILVFLCDLVSEYGHMCITSIVHDTDN